MARWLLPASGVPQRHYVIVVRRGETRLYDELLRSLDRWPPGTRVIWDRRGGDRRSRIQTVRMERRSRQRRAEPDPTWYSHGFIVVEADTPETQGRATA